MATIYTHDNPADGLAVTVTADWSAGKFRVQFRDTDADAIIETRTYSNPDAAIAYARKLIGGINMKTMIAKFPGYCASTGARIMPGDTIDYHGRGRSILRARASARDVDAPDIRESDVQLEPAGAYARLRAPVSDHIVIGGQSYYRNTRGRCEDAPCCGCCTI